MIVFDLDDTLYKEREYVGSAFREIAREAESTGLLSYSEALRLLGDTCNPAPGFSALASVTAAAGITEERMVDIYRTHEPDIVLAPEIGQLLEYYKEQGVQLGLITDGRSSTQRAKIRALGLDSYFDSGNIIISGETGFDKHHREPFDIIMQRNKSEKEFIYVGDNSAKDFLWPNRLGWRTVQLDDTAGQNIHRQNNDRCPEYLAALHISSLTELPEVL